MADERELRPDDEPESPVTDDETDETADFPLRSAEEFEQELEALDEYADAAEDDLDESAAEEEMSEVEEAGAAENEFAGRALPPVTPVPAGEDAVLGTLSDHDRLRQPRAQTFRRDLRNQIGVLPLALYLVLLGFYLIGRAQDVASLPDLSDAAVIGVSLLALSFTLVFHALLSGRRERGLLLVGVYSWVTAGLIAGLVYGIERQPDAREWWPLLVWSLGVTLLITYLIERAHDARLVLLGMIALVAGVTAYGVTSGQIADRWLDTAADYWPLLAVVVGVGVLPVAFRGHLE